MNRSGTERRGMFCRSMRHIYAAGLLRVSVRHTVRHTEAGWAHRLGNGLKIALPRGELSLLVEARQPVNPPSSSNRESESFWPRLWGTVAIFCGSPSPRERDP